ncbi:hypothetical protein E27107_10096 [Elizabethkingia anophelis]|nr:hypothetical protein E18064_440025 [Elizabethkingia anophelis]CDN76694.1 hypothetical protein E27107_10096 [Elizabethkingia anophelis]
MILHITKVYLRVYVVCCYIFLFLFIIIDRRTIQINKVLFIRRENQQVFIVFYKCIKFPDRLIFLWNIIKSGIMMGFEILNRKSGNRGFPCFNTNNFRDYVLGMKFCKIEFIFSCKLHTFRLTIE